MWFETRSEQNFNKNWPSDIIPWIVMGIEDNSKVVANVAMWIVSTKTTIKEMWVYNHIRKVHCSVLELCQAAAAMQDKTIIAPHQNCVNVMSPTSTGILIERQNIMFFTHKTINNNIFRAAIRYDALEVESIYLNLTEIWSYLLILFMKLNNIVCLNYVVIILCIVTSLYKDYLRIVLFFNWQNGSCWRNTFL